MKKHLRSLLVVSSLFALAACGTKKPVDPVPPTPEPPAPEPEQRIDVKFNGYYNDDYSVSMPYSDKYFIDGNAKVFNKELALQSFAMSLSADTVIKENEDYSSASSHIRGYFQNAGFNNVFVNDDYCAKPTMDSVGIAMGSKTLENGDTLLALTVRAGGYGAEWANNLTLGETGCHEGFLKHATALVIEVDNYITTNNIDSSKLKMWISGYSRGGSIVNFYSSLLDDAIKNSPNVYPGLEVEDVFVYTFEAAGCIDPTSKLIGDADFSNIFNVRNNNDFVWMFPPTNYGLTINGEIVDISKDITDEQVGEEMKKLIPEFEMPSFSAVDPRDTETSMTPHEFYDYLINVFLVKEMTPEQKEEGKIVDLSTRKNYVTYIEPHVRYIVSLIMSMTSEQLDAFGKYFQDNMSSIITIINEDKDSLNAFIKAGLDQVGFTEYEQEELHTHCDGLQLVLYSYGVMYGGIWGLAPILMQVMGNIDYMLLQHTQEGMLSYLNLFVNLE